MRDLSYGRSHGQEERSILDECRILLIEAQDSSLTSICAASRAGLLYRRGPFFPVS